MKRLAFFSPLNPLKTGVSDYSEAVLPLLAHWFDIDVFIDDYTPSNESIVRQFEIVNYREFERLRTVRRYDASIYQMGNSLFHTYVRDSLLRFSGVTVLHDVMLHHFAVERMLETDNASLYVREMAYAHGQAGAVLARDAIRGRRPYPIFDIALHERAVDASRSVIVHSRYAAREIQKSRPDAVVSCVPMIESMPSGVPSEALVRSLRERLAIPSDAFVVASFGRLAQPKRIDRLMEAILRLQTRKPNIICLLVGDVAPLFDLQALIQSSGVASRVICTGHLSSEEFCAAFYLADVAVNLRFPTAGETSASAIQLLGHGVPLLVSEIGAFSELPNDVCIKIPVGECEVEALEIALHALAINPVLRTAMGQAARRFVAESHSPGRVMHGYLEHLERSRSARRSSHHVPAILAESISGMGLS